MARVLKSEVVSAFRALAKAAGHPVVNYLGPAGSWRLDYNSTYGGYQVQELVSDESGAVRLPFGAQRRTAAEFYSAAWFAVEAIEIARGTGSDAVDYLIALGEAGDEAASSWVRKHGVAPAGWLTEPEEDDG